MTQRKYNPHLTRLIWLAAAAWLVALFYLATQTGEQSGELSGKFTDLALRLLHHWDYYPDPDYLERLLRKAAHFCIFAFEGFLLALAMLRTLRHRFCGVVLSEALCMVIASANEFSQLLADGRSCELRDMCIDSGGALLGVLVALALHGIVQKIVMIR